MDYPQIPAGRSWWPNLEVENWTPYYVNKAVRLCADVGTEVTLIQPSSRKSLFRIQLKWSITKCSLETPTQPAGTGVWTFYGSSLINAPPSVVWSAIRDFEHYHKWNAYTPAITTPSGTNDIKPNDMITLAYRPEPTGSLMDVPCQILEVNEDAMRLCWRGRAMGLPVWFFCPEKVHIITEREEGCFVEIYETQGGLMAWLVKWVLGEKLGAMSRGMAERLKVYVEGKSPRSE